MNDSEPSLAASRGLGKHRCCMYTPSAKGGHARYTHSLLSAMNSVSATGGTYELLTSRDLDPEYRTNNYVINDILPPLRHRKDFSSRAAWIWDRLSHYHKRERICLKWLRAQRGLLCIHIQEFTPWLAARCFRKIRAMNIAVFSTVHNIRPHKYPKFLPRTLVDHWNRAAWRSCDALFVHTLGLQRELRDFLGSPQPPIHVTCHGTWSVRLSHSPPSIASRRAWRKLLFFGQIRRDKGLHILLDAVRQMRDISLTIAGDPVETEYFASEILPRTRALEKDGVSVNLIDRFLPEGELNELFQSHSAVVLPYTSEFIAQSGVIFLALAYGMPIIATGAGGMGEMFEQFDIGSRIEAETPDAIASAVDRLFSFADDTSIVNGLSRAKAAFSWEACGRATTDAYESTLNKAVLK